MRFEPNGATFFYVAEPQSIFGALRPLIKRLAAVSFCDDVLATSMMPAFIGSVRQPSLRTFEFGKSPALELTFMYV